MNNGTRSPTERRTGAGAAIGRPERNLESLADTESVHFPEGFLWGVATAAHQVEGGNTLNDWWVAETAGRLPASGRASGHWERFEKDFDLVRSWHNTAHRFSVEWSRIEPEAGKWSDAALGHYSDVVDALRVRGLEPVLTLHHFTNPAWFANRGGWLSRDAPTLFARFVERVVDSLGDRVRWWLTVNEPTVWAKHAFVIGDWPPFERGRWIRAGRAIRAMLRAHEAAYRVIHARQPDARVGFAHSAAWVEPCRRERMCDRAVARIRDFMLNGAVFRMIGARSRGAPLDFIGINYYSRTIVRHGWRGAGTIFGVECTHDHHHGSRRWSDMGWEIHARGLLHVLRQFSSYGLPLLVTENGLATDDEELRCQVLSEHLSALAAAVEERLDVRGYFYWALVDNYEWALGMHPHFGLAAMDPATLDRLPRPAAHLFAAVCEGNAVPKGGISTSPSASG